MFTEATRRRAVHLILTAEPALPPPSQPALALGLAEVGGPRILVVAPGRPRFDVTELVMRGREVAFACSLDAALSAMEREQFNLLVVDPHTDGESHGVRFVRALKWMDPRELGAPLVELAHSYRHVPSILTPPAGTSEYAVFLTRTNWFLVDSSRIPLEDTILACSPLRP